MQFSNQYQKAYNDEPQGKLFPHEINGRMRRMFIDVVLGAEITAANPLFMQKLGKGVVISKAKLHIPAGTSGTLNLGWSAGLDEVADDNGLMVALNAAALISNEANIASGEVGINKRFAGQVDLILSASVDSVGLTGNLVKLEIEYVID